VSPQSTSATTAYEPSCHPHETTFPCTIFPNPVGLKILKTLVRLEGLEPPRLAAPEPKSGVSTNFTTGAFAS
jgi:hypothetical protein